MAFKAIALIAAASIALAACGDSKSDDTTSTGAVATTPQATTSPSTTDSGSGSGSSGAGSKVVSGIKVSTDLSAKPTISQATGKAPTALVSKDLVVGTGGAGAKAGDQLVVHYVGVLYDGGEQFDASWDKGSPFPFSLGQGAVIPGWDQGLEGMKIGGRRLLVIPPQLAYADAARPGIPANSTLVFVVDLLNDTPAAG